MSALGMTHVEAGPREPRSLVELVRDRAEALGTRKAFGFLEDGESVERQLSFEALDRQARAIAHALQAEVGAGAVALLLYPPGLEYLGGFFACLYAGVLAVPAYPPDPHRLDRSLERLRSVVGDSGAHLVLTTRSIAAQREQVIQHAPDFAKLRWLATDHLAQADPDGWREPPLGPESPAFLQYTSGSTADPKGVLLSHGNLLHNTKLVREGFELGSEDRGVSWLPPYHDMGLIGTILVPLHLGVPQLLMSPVAFLRRPLRWLEAISRSGASVSGAPNFAYELCVRKAESEPCDGLDLTRWEVAFSGAETVRSATLDRFVEAFAPFGFRREAFYPCYGLAEATLIVTGARRRTRAKVLRIARESLERGRAARAAAGDPGLELVSCGRRLGGQRVLVVDPESGKPLPTGQVGEIWVSGPSVARGYWKRPDETDRLFRARLHDGCGTFLRTGDLGFLRDDELFVTGRIKDLIVLQGRNIGPQEIENAATGSHPALRPGCAAAFSISVDAAERVVLVQEVEPSLCADPEQVAGCIRRAVASSMGLPLHDVVLIEPRSLHKTSSGKPRRHAVRAEYLAGTLKRVA